jgi:hypothetical protein
MGCERCNVCVENVLCTDLKNCRILNDIYTFVHSHNQGIDISIFQPNHQM